MRRFSVPPLKPSSAVKIVFDGNSLVSGYGSTSTTLPVAFGNLLSGSGVTISNIGVAGQSWRMMNGLDGGSAADADSAFDAAKRNILFLWESTNSVFNTSRTAAQTIQDATDYIAARRAAHPAWRIVLINTIPRQTGTDPGRTTQNQVLEAIDAAVLANYRAMGADAVVNLRRPGSYFRFADYSDASFANDPNGYWFESPGTRVHLLDAGYQYIARLCFEAFKRVRAR